MNVIFVILYLAGQISVGYFCHSSASMSACDLATSSTPVVVNTWHMLNATHAAWENIHSSKGSALDAVEAGCRAAEYDQSLESISYGFHPDEEGNVTFDAMIINGDTMEMGAVASMPDIKPAISVARAVMERTRHSMLVGEKATQFAVDMGFKRESLNNERSHNIWKDWMQKNCQPNFRRNVKPSPESSCGPYKPSTKEVSDVWSERDGHDTIGMIALETNGTMAVGTTTNGAQFRVPGRVGDTAVIGSGGYVQSGVGAAVGTGDGDILMRYSLSFLAVEFMRNGLGPSDACNLALDRIPNTVKYHGALAALNAKGVAGGACRGFTDFQVSVMEPSLEKVKIMQIPCK